MTRDRRFGLSFDMKVMRAGFASQCPINQPVDVIAVAQARTQVDMIVLAEAHIDAALDRQADAVAGRAEIVAERGDEPERYGLPSTAK
jgi:hypothetical protein